MMLAQSMIRAPRLTIGSLMAIVSLVAIDFGIVRALWASVPEVGVAIVTLPMIDLLLLSLPKLRRSNRTRPFLCGFQLVGWIMVLIFGLLAWIYPDTFFWPTSPVEQMIPRPHSAAGIALLISLIIVLYTTPMLLFAALAGWLSARYRVVIERRQE